MRDRVAILGGVRTAFTKAGGALAGVPADDLAAIVAREAMARAEIDPREVDQVILGNVGQPAHAANIARVAALKAGVGDDRVAWTVHHNCASGMRSMTAAAMEITSGRANLILCGGTESMSAIPLIVSAEMTRIFVRLSRAKSVLARMRALLAIRPRFLRPVIALQLGLTDPVCELNMGETAEVLAREFGISRAEQDAFSLESHRKAVHAREGGRFADEIVPLPLPPDYRRVLTEDDGPRAAQSLEALAKLRPYFDRQAGTVTVGNACPVTDGAVALLLASERKVRELRAQPLGWLDAWAYAALDGKRMGLGPTHATARLLDETGRRLDDFDLIEINEAFAAQVIANERAFASDAYGRTHLARRSAIGPIDRARLNVNGGAIALGHPVGATGARLALTVLLELRRRGGGRGLATLCVGGGQGAALALEAA